MPAHTTLRTGAKINFNHLRRGTTYRATTTSGAATGEYLGMEALFGDRAVLLRSTDGYESIYQHDIVAIEAA
jgi:hypothetical protein